MSSEEVVAAESRYLLATYPRTQVVFTHGEGAWLYDDDGRRYLDFAAGIAVAALGHGDREWAAAVAEQAGRLTHTSNLFYTVPQVDLAKRLVESSFADRVFFSNSGAEANEAAIKFARRWSGAVHGEDKTDLVAFQGAFHGRSFGALSLTWKEKYRTPFAPLLPGVAFAPFNDLDAAARAITPRTCAVFVEPVQGEAGVRPATRAFLQGLRRLCHENDALLVCDEVQCGLGRTGRLWAHLAHEITPDIMTLAKPLAGGLPIGVTLVTQRVAETITAGDHGSTFGGGPLVCRAACLVFDRVSRPEFLQEVAAKGAHLTERLKALRTPHLVEVRGAGLLVGVEFSVPVKPLVQAALERGLVLITAGDNVLRICPPLILNRDQIDDGIDRIEASLPVLG